MEKWTFLNNSFVDDNEAVLHHRDLSFQRGYGIFDFFRLVGNKPLFLDDYLNRFYHSAEEMHLPVPMAKPKLQTIILDLVQRNNLPNTGIRLGLTGGYTEDGFTPGTPNLIISQHHFQPPSADQRSKGIRLISHPYQRQLPHVKTIDYLMAVWLQPIKVKHSADDFLYHANGNITECPRSNFFLVMDDDKIVTPFNNILQGITRKQVIALAQQHYKVEMRDVLLQEVQTAKEAFITSTTKQVLRVAQLNDKVFTESKVTNHLQELFGET